MDNNQNDAQPDSSRRYPRVPLVSFFAITVALRLAKAIDLLEHGTIVVLFAIGTLALLARYIAAFVTMRRR